MLCPLLDGRPHLSVSPAWASDEREGSRGRPTVSVAPRPGVSFCCSTYIRAGRIAVNGFGLGTIPLGVRGKHPASGRGGTLAVGRVCLPLSPSDAISSVGPQLGCDLPRCSVAILACRAPGGLTVLSPMLLTTFFARRGHSGGKGLGPSLSSPLRWAGSASFALGLWPSEGQVR